MAVVIDRLDASPAGPTLVVGDVHGCAEELAALVERARPGRVVLVGDLFTKGPDPVGVWRLIRRWGARSVLGNHDAWVLEQWDRLPPGRAPQLDALRERAPEVRAWLAGLPLMLRADGWLVVHAGVDPVRGPEGTRREQCLAMRRWPDEDPSNPFWYERWAGPECVVFGHDARRGLVRREAGGRPIAVGLDTGCVYGGLLTGYLVEEDALLQEPARAVHHPV